MPGNPIPLNIKNISAKDEISVEIFEPNFDSKMQAFGCRVVIQGDQSIDQVIYGEDELQSIQLAALVAKMTIYG
ncbi:MAG: DUF6968 family protein [Brevundimonas sp.]|uniref:DUF6968 family protein n=1 Tax=Brevundimonas sp. TaxID=1871086 RepID=UPI00391A7BB2